MAQIQTHSKMLDEILSEVNSSVDVVESLRSAFATPYVKNYIELAVSQAWTTLDTSAVPYKEYGYERSMAGATLLNKQTWAIVSQVLMVELVKNHTKAHQFKALSEMMWSGEVAILHAILLKNLPELYPNITFETIVKALA
jgi:hypothetical protein